MKNEIKAQAEEKVKAEAKGKDFSKMTSDEVRRWHQERYREHYRKLHIGKSL